MSETLQEEQRLRAALVEVGQRMHALGFAAGSDGNLSARLTDGRILITPSGLSKGFLEPEQLLLVNRAGEVQGEEHAARGLRPSSEMFMHLEAYHQRPDVGGVIHAHPPLAIACTLAGISLATCMLPEVIYHLGSIPAAPFATPGTPDGAAAIRALVQHHDAILLTRHGSLTLGATPAHALMRLEWVEQAAKVMLAAHAATGGRLAPLPAEQVATIQAMRRHALAQQGREASAAPSDCRCEE